MWDKTYFRTAEAKTPKSGSKPRQTKSNFFYSIAALVFCSVKIDLYRDPFMVC